MLITPTWVPNYSVYFMSGCVGVGCVLHDIKVMEFDNFLSFSIGFFGLFGFFRVKFENFRTQSFFRVWIMVVLGEIYVANKSFIDTMSFDWYDGFDAIRIIEFSQFRLW